MPFKWHKISSSTASQPISVHCVGFRENEDAVRLVREMELEEMSVQPFLLMSRDHRHPQAISDRVFAITSCSVCGFWRLLLFCYHLTLFSMTNEFWRFGGQWTHFSKRIMVKFGVRKWTLDSDSPVPNFVRIAQGICPLRANLYQIVQILMIFGDFSPDLYMCTHFCYRTIRSTHLW